MELPNDSFQSILKKPIILEVPLPRVEKRNEKLHLQVANVTIAQVHELNRSERNHSKPSSPEMTAEVVDGRPLSTSFVLNEVVSAESTDF